MTLNAGSTFTGTQATQLEAKTGLALQAGNAGNTQAITTTETDLLNASVTITTTAASATWIVVGAFDFSHSGGTDVAIGRLSVDGVTQAGEAHVQCASQCRMTVAQVWRGTVSAGSHTFKLRGAKVGSSNSISSFDSQTSLQVHVFETP